LEPEYGPLKNRKRRGGVEEERLREALKKLEAVERLTDERIRESDTV